MNQPINPDPEFEPQNNIESPLEEQQTVVVTEDAASTDVTDVTDATYVTETTEGTFEPGPAVVEVKRDVQSGMFGVPETAALVFSCLVLLGVIGFYFLVLAPAQNDLKNRKAQRNEQEKKLDELKKRFGDSTDTEKIVANLERSVEDFEFRFLPLASLGKASLYDRINGLIYAYRLRNTAGPAYSPLEIATLKADQPQEERGKTKFQSLFPGVYISMTVEGSYVNLRRFISELEASQQFVVISAVELEAAENTQQDTQDRPPNTAGGVGTVSGKPVYGQPGPPVQQTTRPAGPRGKTMGETVSLHLEMAAYFRRDMPMIPAEVPGAVK